MIQDENAKIDAGMVEVDFPLAGPGGPVWLCEELLDDLQSFYFVAYPSLSP